MTVRIQCDTLLLTALRQNRLDTVAGAFAYGGGTDLHKAGLGHRRRTRIEISDLAGNTRVLYLKRYGPERLMTAIGRWSEHGRRVSPAGVEFDNINAARSAGIPTMEAVACGEEFSLIGAKRSFLLATEVPGDALERCFEDFLDRNADTPREVIAVTGKLAGLVAALHRAGYVHRDLYASHVFMDESPPRPELYVIDLARMFRPRRRTFRWRVKDLAQLKYSMPPRWLESHWEGFLKVYFNGAAADEPVEVWTQAIDAKVAWMRARSERKRLASVAAGQGGAS